VRGVAVFFRRSCIEDGTKEDYGNEGNDEKRGRDEVHGRNSLIKRGAERQGRTEWEIVEPISWIATQPKNNRRSFD
jgi:hypothetical protein